MPLPVGINGYHLQRCLLEKPWRCCLRLLCNVWLQTHLPSLMLAVPSGLTSTFKYKRDKVNASLALSHNTVSSVDNLKSLKASVCLWLWAPTQ
jgi:hypothetical protein